MRNQSFPNQVGCKTTVIVSLVRGECALPFVIRTHIFSLKYVKPSHCEELWTAGLQVVFEQAYYGASVRDKVQAAGMPHGVVHQPLVVEGIVLP